MTERKDIWLVEITVVLNLQEVSTLSASFGINTWVCPHLVLGPALFLKSSNFCGDFNLKKDGIWSGAIHGAGRGAGGDT